MLIFRPLIPPFSSSSILLFYLILTKKLDNPWTRTSRTWRWEGGALREKKKNRKGSSHASPMNLSFGTPAFLYSSLLPPPPPYPPSHPHPPPLVPVIPCCSPYVAVIFSSTSLSPPWLWVCQAAHFLTVVRALQYCSEHMLRDYWIASNLFWIKCQCFI